MKRRPRRLHIAIASAPAVGAQGASVTAERWARWLRQLGHRVTLTTDPGSLRLDLLIVLGVTRGASVIERARAATPALRIIVGLTGADLYRDVPATEAARAALELADLLVVPQRLAKLELPEELRARARIIHPSVEKPTGSFGKRSNTFEVCLLADMRPEKDPFLPVQAALLLPATSHVQIVHVGLAPDAETQRTAEEWQSRTDRYVWRGVLPQWKAVRLLARCRALVVPSQFEGGANAVCEAIAVQVPVLASHIPGNLGLLGDDYPGTFPVGDTAALARLLQTIEEDEVTMRLLKLRVRKLRALVDPHREQEAWRGLLLEVGLGSE